MLMSDKKLILFIFIIFTLKISQIFSHNNPKSPCPKIFQYRYDGMEWFGILKINLATFMTTTTTSIQTIPKIVHVKVTLSQKGRPPTNYLGEIELLNKGQQPQKQQEQNSNSSNDNGSNNNPFLMYKVNFPYGQHPPRITQIFVNNQLLCSGPPDTGIIVTVINLEHTRKSGIRILADSNPISSNDQLPDDQLIAPWRMNSTTAKNCGQIESKTFLTSDQSLVRGAWPWLAAIYVNNLTTLSYQCSGSLISSRIVITAAHCLYQYKSNDILVFLGRFNLKDWSEEHSLAVSCDNIFIHPDFDGNLKTFDADIAILILKNEIRFNDFIRPVCLWTGSTSLEYIENEQGYVVGWSNSNSNNNNGNNDDESMMPIPKLVRPVIVSNRKCLEFNEKLKNLVTKRNFCTENDGNYGLCNGYSGAGLMVLRNNRFTLRGIVSASLPSFDSFDTLSLPSTFRAASCNTSKITILTDVAKFLDWITAFLI